MFTLRQEVTHPLHGYGLVVDLDAPKKLVTIFALEALRYVDVHPVSLTPYAGDVTVEEPTTQEEVPC